MYYITPDRITFSGDCCPTLVTDLTHLLPFQVISQGAFQKLEYRLYGETVWTELAITYSEVVIEGFYFISYNGTAIAELPCGVYEFRLTAGELWWLEPIMVDDFTITENALSVRDELMLPFKITEQLADTTALIAPCDMILPFMFRTSNVTSGTITVYMVDEDGTETEITITVSTGIIDGVTYCWHSEEYIYPFLTCGRYYLKIVDGANTYYSVPFVPECGISDIPDGYKVLRDFNGCVIRSDEGVIEYEEASPLPAPFMMTIDTTKAGSANDTFILPITAISGYYDVDWGDGGAIETFTTIGNKSHTYSVQGIYQVSVNVGMTAISFPYSSDRAKVIYIDQWGDIVWSSMYRAFAYCTNMTGRYTDVPNTSAVTNFAAMFAGCSLFNQAVVFDTSAATKMYDMFNGCTVFNQSVAGFDTSSVDDMRFMFQNCAAFNQSVSNFDTSHVTLISSMFSGCTVFNQSVSNFDTSLVSNFYSLFTLCVAFNQSVANLDTSIATDISGMFAGCTSFNQSVANFDTSLVTNFQGIFRYCSSFKQSLATFSLASATNTFLMLDGADINAAGTSTNYDNTLIAWAAADVPNGLTFHGGTSKYSDTGQTARTSLINDDSWTITADGGHI